MFIYDNYINKIKTALTNKSKNVAWKAHTPVSLPDFKMRLGPFWLCLGKMSIQTLASHPGCLRNEIRDWGKMLPQD